jgi:hypothetical protein
MLMPSFVICVGVKEPCTKAEIVKQLWDTMETGGENNDASYKDVIEDPR